jgi:hypothetical protein
MTYAATLAAIVTAFVLVGCGDSGPSRIYGKWQQGPITLEFTEKTVAMGPMTVKVVKYEVNKDKITVFVENEKNGLTFNFKSDKEMCIDGAGAGAPAGCFTKV